MIATHNVNVNGTWYRVGETIPDEMPKSVESPVNEETQVEETSVDEEKQVEETSVDEEPKESPKVRSASTRRKTTVK